MAEELATNYGLQSSLIRLKPSSEIFADFGAETVPIIENDEVIGYEIRLNEAQPLAESKLRQLVHHELGHVKLREMGYPIYAVDPNSLNPWFSEAEIGYFAKLIDLPNEYYTILLSLRFDEDLGWVYIESLMHLNGVGRPHRSFVRSAVSIADAVVAKQVCLEYGNDLADYFETTIRKADRMPRLLQALRAIEQALTNLPELPLNRFSPEDIEAIEYAYGAIGSSLLPEQAGFVITQRRIQNGDLEEEN